MIISERIDPQIFPEEFIWRRLRSLTYPLARRIVVQTRDAKNFFPIFLQKKISVIANPVPVPIEVPTKASEKIVSALGRLENRRKGFDLLVTAFSFLQKKYPDWKLIIMGEGPDRKNLELLRERLGLGSQIEFPGQVPDPWTRLSASTIFVMPSRVEGFPNALCEAMATGIPVIASDCNGCRDIIQDNSNGLLFASGKIESLTKKLDWLMSDSELRSRLSNHGKSMAEKLNPTIVVNEWEKIIALRKK